MDRKIRGDFWLTKEFELLGDVKWNKGNFRNVFESTSRINDTIAYLRIHLACFQANCEMDAERLNTPKRDSHQRTVVKFRWDECQVVGHRAAPN